MRRLIILYPLLFLLVLPLAAQTEETPESLYDDAEYFFFREDYEEAAYLFRTLLLKEPENANVMYMLGLSYLNIRGQEYKAIPVLEKAVMDISYKFKKNRYTEKHAPQYAWYYLGNAYRIDNQLDKALEAYDNFLAVRNFDKRYNLQMVEDEIKSVERAKIIKDAKVDIYQYCFDEPINTVESDYAGVISANEKVMVWISSQKFYDAIMMSVKQDGKWSAPVNITPQVGSDGDMSPTGLSADGSTLYMVRRTEYDADIFVSSYDGKLWSKAVPVPGEVNSNFNEEFASVSSDGNMLFISSDRPESLGGFDIFVSRKNIDGTWGTPEPLDEHVNTAVDETAPCLSPDGKLFFFSSKGHYNMGGYDIFYSEVADDGSLSTAINLGYPVNTTGDNTYFIPIKDGMTGLYSRYTNDGIGRDDLWMIEVLPFEELVAKALTRLSEENFRIELNGNNGEKIILIYDSVKDLITVTSEKGITYKVVYSREDVK